MTAVVPLLRRGMSNFSYMGSIPALKPAPSSLSELQRGLQDARQWHGSDNGLLIGEDAGCPVHISMTPAGRSAAVSPPGASLMQLPAQDIILDLCLYIVTLPCCH